MWLMVQFDLPVATAEERRAYSRFRKELIRAGFTQFQKSIYLRWEDTDGQGSRTASAIRRKVPPKGTVTVLQLPPGVFERSFLCRDGEKGEPPEVPGCFVLV